MWYWGENGRSHRGRVIVVGADNEYIPQILGYETAATMDEALRMAKETAPNPDPSNTCFRICPLMLADVTLTPEEKRKLLEEQEEDSSSSDSSSDSSSEEEVEDTSDKTQTEAK